ncbi:MAG: sensor histidine kinase [Aestuariivirga sp.]
MAAIIALFVQRELRGLSRPQDDAGWALYQLGLEHERLMLALQTGAGADEVTLRGEIYLSRVLLVRDAPALAKIRINMNPLRLSELFRSVQTTERLLHDVGKGDWRTPLLAQVKADAPAVRELTLDMTALNRKLLGEERTHRTESLLLYLVALELLLLALLGLGIAVLRITRKLRAAGRELAAQTASQEAILRSVNDAILGLGTDGKVLYSNRRAVEWFGPSAERGASLSSEGPGTALLPAIRDLLAPGGNEDVSTGLVALRRISLTSSGEARHLVIRAYRPVASADIDMGNTSIVVTIADVTSEELAAQRRAEYDAGIAEASRLLAYAAISGGIVHEISQPLAAIRNYIHALKVSLGLRPGNEEQRAIVEHLGAEVDRAIEVVRNVRRMGPADPEDAGSCDIGEAIAHSVRLVSLGSNPPPPISVPEARAPVIVSGSLPLIGQVIVNLLKNALSASKSAGQAGAKVSVATRGDCAEIAVTDFGNGVSPEAAKMLFTPFNKSSRGGMGLGLAICQRIATALGGSLSWENREGAGAVFKFTVPLVREGHSP